MNILKLNAILHYISIFFISVCIFERMPSVYGDKKQKGGKTPFVQDHVKVLNYQNSMREIVADLIDNWQSPIVYLKNRGYFPKELQDGPNLNIEMQKTEQDPQEFLQSEKCRQENNVKERKNIRRYIKKSSVPKIINGRLHRSTTDETNAEMKNMLRTLFSSDDKKVSDEINKKLGLRWDINAIKTAAHKEAKKYYEQYYNKRNDDKVLPNNVDISQVDAEVAQLYPSVVIATNKDLHWDIKNKALITPTSYKEPNFLKGIAKILSNRELMEKAKSLPNK